MAVRIATKTKTAPQKKAKPAARLTTNDKQVMKRANLLRGTPRKRKKDTKDESTDGQ